MRPTKRPHNKANGRPLFRSPAEARPSYTPAIRRLRIEYFFTAGKFTHSPFISQSFICRACSLSANTTLALNSALRLPEALALHTISALIR